MNKKNNEKRQSASLNRIAHKRLKEFAEMRGFKLNRVIDDAVFMYLKMQITAPMIQGDIAAEAAWEYERLTADGRIHNHGLLTRVIQAAIEKGIQAWLCDKGWQGKTFEPIIEKAYADGHSQGEKEQG